MKRFPAFAKPASVGEGRSDNVVLEESMLKSHCFAAPGATSTDTKPLQLAMSVGATHAHAKLGAVDWIRPNDSVAVNEVAMPPPTTCFVWLQSTV